MGTYVASELDLKAYRWCIKNKIHIAPKAINETRWTIVITNNGKTHEDPSHYIKDLIWEKIYEYYKYYYEQKIQQRKWSLRRSIA